MINLTRAFFTIILLICSAITAETYETSKINPDNTVNAAAFTSLSSAVSSSLATGKTIIVATLMKVDDLTIPKTIGLRVVKGGGFILEPGKTLTIKGPFDAGLFQVFQGKGGVTGLKSVHPEWWGAQRDGTTDDGEAIRSATMCINKSGGGDIVFSSGTYLVYKVGLTYSFLGAFSNCTGVNIISKGATLAQDPSRNYTGSNGAMFIFNNCKSVKVNGFKVTGPVMDITATRVKGNEFVQFNNGSEGLEMLDNNLQGVTGGLLIKDDIKPGNPCRNIRVSNMRVKQSWYGITGQNSGSDMIIDNLNTDTVHRSLFIYGVKNVIARVRSKDAYSYDVFLNSFIGSDLENIEVFYERTKETQNSSDGSECIRIQASDSKAAIFKDIKLHLNINYNTTGQTGAAAVRISKMTSSGTVFDTYEPGRGHRFENIVIDGYIEGNSHYAEPVIFMDTLSKWGNGDYFSNIRLRDLTINNNNRGIYFFTGPFVNPLIFENVNSSAAVNWSPNDSNATWDHPLLAHNSTFPNQYVDDVFRATNVFTLNSNAEIVKGWSTKTLTNKGATSLVFLSLPTATPGLSYKIVRDATFEIRIKPKEMDSIGDGYPGKYLSLNSPDNSVSIKCVNPGEWKINAHSGTLRYEH